jgi:hypothetical protein
MRQLLVLGIALLACGGNDDGVTPDAAPGGGGASMITVSGAQDATMPATAVASKVNSEAFWTFGVSITSPQSGFTSASASIRLAGSPTTGSYPASTFLVGALEASTSGGMAWSAFSTPTIGTLGTLQITSVQPGATTGNTTLYIVQGTLAEGTLVSSGGGASLMMRASF